MSDEIAVPPSDAPEQAQQTFKDAIAKQSGKNAGAITALTKRVETNEGDIKTLQDTPPLFEVKEFGAVTSIDPFEGSDSTFAHVYLVTEHYVAAGQSSGVTVRSIASGGESLIIAQKNFSVESNFSGIGGEMITEFGLTPNSMFENSITAVPGTSSGSTTEVLKWIVHRF